jgi:hypothetical protein
MEEELFVIPVRDCILYHIQLYKACIKSKTDALIAGMRTMVDQSVSILAGGLAAVAAIKVGDFNRFLGPINVPQSCNAPAENMFGNYQVAFFGDQKTVYVCEKACVTMDVLKQQIKLYKPAEFPIICCYDHHFMVESVNEVVIMRRMVIASEDGTLPVYFYQLKNRYNL